MGANQSGFSSEITVVNQNPNSRTDGSKIVLPPRVPPILSIEGHAIDPGRHGPEHQLNIDLWLGFVEKLDHFTNSRSELVASRQTKLQEKIADVDNRVQRFTDSYINDKHKALARLNENHRKMEDICKLLHKCSVQSKICVDMLNKLNFLLPDEDKLEPLAAD